MAQTQAVEPASPEPVLRTFVSNDENIQRKRTYKVQGKREHD